MRVLALSCTVTVKLWTPRLELGTLMTIPTMPLSSGSWEKVPEGRGGRCGEMSV